MVLDGIVQQRGARHVRVDNAVTADDRHSQQVVCIGFALPSVSRLQPGCERQRVLDLTAISSEESGDLYQQPFPPPGTPCTEVIACSGIPASSRRSAGPVKLPGVAWQAVYQT